MHNEMVLTFNVWYFPRKFGRSIQRRAELNTSKNKDILLASTISGTPVFEDNEMVSICKGLVNVFIITGHHSIVNISHHIDRKVRTKVALHTDSNDLFYHNKNLDTKRYWNKQ